MEEVGHRAHTLGSIVGLALRNASECPMELNLRPASVIRRETESRQRPAFVVAALCLLAGLAVWWLYLDRTAQITREVVEQLQPKVSTLKSYEDRLKAVRLDIKAQEELATPFLESVRERDYWARILNDINGRIPPDFLWITSFEPEQRKEPPPPVEKGKPAPPKPVPGAPVPMQSVVTLQGLYLFNANGPAVVDEFVKNLSESEHYKVEPGLREVQNETEWAFRWSATLILTKPVAYTPTISARRNK